MDPVKKCTLLSSQLTGLCYDLFFLSGDMKWERSVRRTGAERLTTVWFHKFFSHRLDRMPIFRYQDIRRDSGTRESDVTCSSTFLVIVLQRLAQRVMNDESHVRLVNTHSKSSRSDHHLCKKRWLCDFRIWSLHDGAISSKKFRWAVFFPQCNYAYWYDN